MFRALCRSRSGCGKKSNDGFLAKLAFWKGSAPPPQSKYRVFVKDSGAVTNVQVLSAEWGRADRYVKEDSRPALRTVALIVCHEVSSIGVRADLWMAGHLLDDPVCCLNGADDHVVGLLAGGETRDQQKSRHLPAFCWSANRLLSWRRRLPLVPGVRQGICRLWLRRPGRALGICRLGFRLAWRSPLRARGAAAGAASAG